MSLKIHAEVFKEVTGEDYDLDAIIIDYMKDWTLTSYFVYSDLSCSELVGRYLLHISSTTNKDISTLSFNIEKKFYNVLKKDFGLTAGEISDYLERKFNMRPQLLESSII